MNLDLFEYEWKLIETELCNCSLNEYSNAVEIWLTKPHVVNRRVCTSQVLWRMKELPNPKLSSSIVLEFLLDDLSLLTNFVSKTEEIQTLYEQHYQNFIACSTQELKVNKDGERSSFANKQLGLECCVRKLLPRNRKSEFPVNEIILIDNSTSSISFVFIPLEVQPTIPRNFQSLIKHAGYKLLFNENEHSLKLFVGQEYSAPSTGSFARPSISWLKNHLLPRLLKWATESNPNPGNVFTSLIAMDEYSQLYGKLKEKYGAKFVKIWTEVTDPLKFVYEDVAIAAYILTLWRHERDERGLSDPQSFIDLGCGNGLLVHILNCEGHPGKGVDVRRRKIWDLYGEETCLEETAITPSDSNLFPEYDWLIGNHSDELTPWIPVIASRSSFDTRYFVLPCCFHDFNCKFSRKKSSQGQYRSYLDFVADIGKTCGFDVLEDRLRIPSTKRICQVGKQRTYKPEEQATIDNKITELIQRRSCLNKSTGVNQSLVCDMQIGSTPGSHDVGDSEFVTERKRELDTIDNQRCSQKMKCSEEKEDVRSNDKNHVSKDSYKWVQGFIARDKVERVRNCATLSVDLRQEIISKVAFRLLEEGGVDLNVDSDTPTPTHKWRRGGQLDLPAIAKFLGSDTLKKLKQECGGLKTLLKNANQVFKVSGNFVQVRDWAKSDLRSAKSNQSLKRLQDKGLLFKTKHCWFHGNHPDGCPLPIETCPFAHGDDDLRERPSFR
ncbi:probable tRNA (uracil-O(2)-)-methyltransferase [Anneissia japonica]|uniref:probable tRNA (uracil-O(2)-)-methyltransferase n=1 Tax=Anneissia japonica TaxID=1529436 RepID=UPI0014259265|nr:probable tRNA (uracil-O(2)-)-methyltransferase [Anneissia japonica]